MTQAVQTDIVKAATNSSLADAAKEALIAGFIALVLFGTMIGFKTEASPDGLIVEYRWGTAIALSAAVVIVRLVFDLFVWRRVVKPEKLTARISEAVTSTAAIAVLAFLYTLGAAFFLLDGTRTAVIDGFVSILSWTPATWHSKLRTLADLLTFGITAVFLVGTALGFVRALRYASATIFAKKMPAPPRLVSRSTIKRDMWSDFGPALFVVALVLPLLIVGPQQRYAVDTAIQVLTYIMLGWGLNVVVGLAGLLDLGYVAFYAVGAYSFALIATEFGWSFWVCLPIAGFLAALWGVILGFPVLRLRGDYLAIVTLAFGEIIRIVLLNWYSLTNGPDGISRIPKLTFFGLEFKAFGDNTFHGFFGIEYHSIHRVLFLYYVILALAMLTNFVTMRLRRLPIGRAWEALREDEIACRTLGINTVSTKLTAFATGAMFGGFAGSFFATRQGFISPESFTFQESALVLAIVVLGGLGSQIGVVIAAVVLIGSSEFFRDLEQYRMLIFGACMVAIMVWRPRGLIATRTPSVALTERKAISGDLVKEGAG